MSRLQTAAVKPTASKATATDPAARYLTFLLGEETFALDICSVREIIQYCPMTSVPLMPDFVQGVIKLRGAVVPVIDLQVRFGRHSAPVGRRTCIVIVDCLREGERSELGFQVDAVNEVLDIAADAIEAPPNFGASVRREFIRGMGKLDSQLVIILEPDKAFDVVDVADLCTTTPARPAN